MKYRTITTMTIVFVLFLGAFSLLSNKSSSNKTSSTTTPGCLVTISGKNYDVTRLRNTHSGGNIFVCGTDMTQMYMQQHGANVSMLRPYLAP